MRKPATWSSPENLKSKTNPLNSQGNTCYIVLFGGCHSPTTTAY